MTDLAGPPSTALAGRYRLERELGRGGMATVFLPQDLKHPRRVAIKVLDPELTVLLGPERFLREIEIAARLQHPHILTLLDSGEAQGLLYHVMPYVSVSFTLPDASSARLAAYGISGREVSRREVGHLGMGRHVVTLSARKELAPGVYLVHRIQGNRRLVARAVVIRRPRTSCHPSVGVETRTC